MILAHDLAGDGPTVVLPHSSVADRRMWDPRWAPLLDAGYQVLRCDFRGHGDTPAPHAPFNPADDVRHLLDSLGIGAATSTADFLAATVPAAARAHLAWAGHLPSVEDPAAFNPMLLSWLEPDRAVTRA